MTEHGISGLHHTGSFLFAALQRTLGAESFHIEAEQTLVVSHAPEIDKYASTA